MEKVKLGVAIAMITLLGLFLAFAFWPYVNALFGALILFVLFSPVYTRLKKRLKWGSLSAIITILITILIVILPIFILSSILVGEVQDIVPRAQSVVESLYSVEILDEYIENFELQELIKSQISEVAGVLRTSFFSIANKVTLFIFNIFIMYFLLYYLFLNSSKIKKFGYEVIPFSKKNSRVLIKEFSRMTNAVIIATGVIALMQGFVLGLVFYLVGVPAPILWGVIGFFLSFLPVVGIPLLWVPAGLLKLSGGEPFAAIVIFVSGLILSNVDNFIRPAIQNKVGKIHPLVTLIGVFVGVPVFGLLGLIIGPLLLSYFFLGLRMFKEEYMAKS